MPYPAEHRDRMRHRIVRSARKLFHRFGFDAVSIEDIMADAGLTRGGFYSYFASKGQLYAEAVTLTLAECPAQDWDGVSIDFLADDVAPQIIRAYLSHQHFEAEDSTCPLVALPSDIARAGSPVKQAFQTVFTAMVDVYERGLQRAGRPDRQRALAIAALCVGGMVLARGVEDRTIADEVREAAMRIALELGGWLDRLP